MKLLRSFRVQLFIIAGVLFGLLLFTLDFGTRTAANAANSQAIVNLVGQQRSTVLLFDSTFDRLEMVTDESERASLKDLIRSLEATFDAGEEALRSGDPEQGITAITNPDALAVFEQVDSRWHQFKETIATGLAATPEQLAELDMTIDNQSAALYAFSDRLANAINTLVSQQLERSQRLAAGLGLVSFILLIVAFFVINNIARSVNRLVHTADRLSNGDLSVRAGRESIEEVARLAATFNTMASQVESRIADTEAARDQAERADKVKSAFLASMSHELRTPLNSVINFTKFVHQGIMGPVNKEQQEALGEVIDSGKHLLSLINDVLDMSKIESGTLKLFMEDQVDVQAVLESAHTKAKSLLVDKPIELKLELESSLPTIRADRQRLLQILLNILSNACKFTEQGSIRIKAYTAGDELVFAVQDTGPGIAPEDQAAVFEPFRQTETGLRQGGGTGLGMPISQKLAEAHGGRIWLESNKGEGATFYVSIPIHSKLTVASAA